MSELSERKTSFELRLLSRPSDQSTILFRQIVAGACAGAVTKTIIAPLERVKILQQIQGMSKTNPFKYRGILGSLRTVVSEEGVLAMFKGNGANVLRVIPNYALKFACTDMFKDIVRRSDQSNKDLSFYQVMASGTLAGLVQVSLTYPLEVMRTRLSLSDSLNLSGGVRYRGISDCMIQIYKSEGITAFYKGIGPTFISGAPYVGLQMTFFDLFKKLLPQNSDGSSSTLWKLASGALAGVVAQTITYPGDTLRRRMQTNGVSGQPRVYRNSWDCCVQIVNKEGMVGLFRGYNANLARGLPGAAIQFVAYDLFKIMFNVD